MTFKTKWTHQPVSLTEEQQQILTRQIADISDDLDKASDLIFHTVFLAKDMKGAIVIVDSKEDVDDTLYLTYYENPNWTTLADIEDDEDDVDQELLDDWKLDNN